MQAERIKNLQMRNNSHSARTEVVITHRGVTKYEILNCGCFVAIESHRLCRWMDRARIDGVHRQSRWLSFGVRPETP
jgi:hypothetical protein